MAENLIRQANFQRRTQQRRQMALTMANQSSLPNKQAIAKAWDIVKREGDRIQLVSYPAKKYGGQTINRVVRPGVPPGYRFKTNFRIESQGRTPMWDQAKRISGTARDESIISNARGVSINIRYQGDRAGEFYRGARPAVPIPAIRI